MGVVVDHLFIDFANSEWYDGKGNLEDRLRDPSWLRGFLQERGLAGYGPLNETELHELAELRSAIRSIAQRLRAGRRLTGHDLGYLNGVLASHPMGFRLSGRGTQPELDVAPLTRRGSRVIAGEIAMSAARFLAEKEPGRLKMCDNPGCRWMFHDETKNRSRRWCGPCGNVDKARRFRERRRLAQGR